MNQQNQLINELKDSSYNIEEIRSKLRSYGIEHGEVKKIIEAIEIHRTGNPRVNTPPTPASKSKMIVLVVIALIMVLVSGLVAFIALAST